MPPRVKKQQKKKIPLADFLRVHSTTPTSSTTTTTTTTTSVRHYHSRDVASSGLTYATALQTKPSLLSSSIAAAAPPKPNIIITTTSNIAWGDGGDSTENEQDEQQQEHQQQEGDTAKEDKKLEQLSQEQKAKLCAQLLYNVRHFHQLQAYDAQRCHSEKKKTNETNNNEEEETQFLKERQKYADEQVDALFGASLPESCLTVMKHELYTRRLMNANRRGFVSRPKSQFRFCEQISNDGCFFWRTFGYCDLYHPAHLKMGDIIKCSVDRMDDWMDDDQEELSDVFAMWLPTPKKEHRHFSHSDPVIVLSSTSGQEKQVVTPYYNLLAAQSSSNIDEIVRFVDHDDCATAYGIPRFKNNAYRNCRFVKKFVHLKDWFRNQYQRFVSQQNFVLKPWHCEFMASLGHHNNNFFNYLLQGFLDFKIVLCLIQIFDRDNGDCYNDLDKRECQNVTPLKMSGWIAELGGSVVKTASCFKSLVFREMYEERTVTPFYTFQQWDVVYQLITFLQYLFNELYFGIPVVSIEDYSQNVLEWLFPLPTSQEEWIELQKAFEYSLDHTVTLLIQHMAVRPCTTSAAYYKDLLQSYKLHSND